jgi:hypothetical protein
MKKGVSLGFLIFCYLLNSLVLVRGIQGSDSLLPPSYLIAVDEQDGFVPLYWFKPGSQSYELSYDDGTKEHQFYVYDKWLNNKAGIRISVPSSPFILLKSKAFISYQGAEDDTLYDFKMPFLISVNSDSGGIPGQILWGPFWVNATGVDSSFEGGEWVEITHNLLFQEDSDFWIVFHWKENSPKAPLIGEDDSPNSGRSFYYVLNDYGYYEWKQLSGYNLMMRSVIAMNDSSDTLSSIDNFRIYRSEGQDFSLSSENLKDSVGIDQFDYTDFDVENGQTYFYKLTSIFSGDESEPSNEVQVTPKKGAELWVEKDVIEVSLDTNQTQLEYLNLSNTGGIDLEFSMEIDLSIDDSAGGKDHFGYTWTDNRKKPELEFKWVDITDSGTLLNTTGPPSEIYGPISLGFYFPFYSNQYDSLWIMLNGCLCFNSIQLLKWKNDTLPHPLTHLNLIAPFWSNLWFEDSTRIYYYSTSDSFVVSFINMKHFLSGNHFTFQVILTESGEIDFQYKQVEDPSTSATIGMQNDDGSCGLLISYNQDYPDDSLRVKILPGWIEIEPRKDKIPPGEDVLINLLFNSDFLGFGSYTGSLNIESRDKNHQLEPFDISLILNVESFKDTLSDTTNTDTTDTDTTDTDTTDTDTTTAVFGAEEMADVVSSLQQNYPNPFNASTIVSFTVHSKRRTENGPIPTSLKIYNVKGELVRTLMEEKKKPGECKVIWDGKNQKGEDVASGIYFYKLKAGDFSQTKKMILLR